MKDRLSSSVLAACHKLDQSNCIHNVHELSKSARVGEG
jgi:hypothetical protein